MAEDIDLTEAKINIAKFRADGEKYFSLFDRHIPTGLGSDCEVLLYKIGNMAVIKGIVDKNPTAKYAVYDRECICRLTKIACPGVDATGYASDAKSRDPYDIFEDKDMKFDLIIMNPPYSRNLHLKILAEAIRHLKDENSLCINLSPIRWLQDPLAKFKKQNDLNVFKDTVVSHIIDVFPIDSQLASNIFNGGVPSLAVYCTDKNIHADVWIKKFENNIIIRIFEHISKCKFDENKREGVRVKISPICGNGTAGNHAKAKETLRSLGKLLYFMNGIKDGKPWYSFYAHNGATKIQAAIPYSIAFNSEQEADNFCLSYKTNLAKYYTHKIKRDVHVSPNTILWLGDAVNPRTGLKGYLGEWTDEDLYAYFNITEDEKKLIEQTMEKYR